MDYLNISCAQDLREKKERILYRFLEILPGFLSFFTLFFALIFSWKKPVWVGIFIIFFDVYWILKILYLSFHQVSAFLKMRKNLKINWLERVKEIPNWEKIYHLVILPFYKEGPEIIEDSLNSILNSNYPKDKIIVVVGGEERAKENALKVKEMIKKNFSGKFLALFFTLHPSNLPGEIPGKGSNFAFAFKFAKNEISKIEIPFENIIVSNFDVDTRPYPDYFACLTYNFLKQRNSNLASFQPIPIYNNNIWEAPSFSRVVAMSGSFWQMMQQERPEVLVSYSSHSIPFEVLDKIGYPKNVVSDDSRVFWKAFLFYNGNYRVIPLFYPVSMDAVVAENFFRTIMNQYKQQRRWAFGCSDIPFLLFGFFKNKKIPFFKKLWHSFVILEGFWSWATASLLIAFLGWLPIFIGGEGFNITLFSYNLPILTRNLMTLAMFGIFVCGALNFLILPKKPKEISNLKYLSFFFQWLFLPVTLIVFGSIPALDAQLRLFFGKYLGFWSTEKIRKTKK
jgi:cellulose synthase/poly-beta-1,6-N-acetylglucosamine synthase-like glycosyltransferase